MGVFLLFIAPRLSIQRKKSLSVILLAVTSDSNTYPIFIVIFSSQFQMYTFKAFCPLALVWKRIFTP